MKSIRLIKIRVKQSGEIPQIGDETYFQEKGQTVYGIILSIESIKYDERRKLNITYKVKVTERKGMKLIKG